jgi:ArsR family transcriptional regulator
MTLDTSYKNLESLFLALADKTRLRILNLIGEDEICVGSLVEVLGESQPKISRHLAYLKNAGLVSVRRDGKWMHYRIIEPETAVAAKMLNSLLAWLGEQEEMRKERGHLEKIGGVTLKVVNPKKTAARPRPKQTEQENIYGEAEPDTYFAEEENEPPAEPAQQPYQRQELETFLL